MSQRFVVKNDDIDRLEHTHYIAAKKDHQGIGVSVVEVEFQKDRDQEGLIGRTEA